MKHEYVRDSSQATRERNEITNSETQIHLSRCCQLFTPTGMNRQGRGGERKSLQIADFAFFVFLSCLVLLQVFFLLPGYLFSPALAFQ